MNYSTPTIQPRQGPITQILPTPTTPTSALEKIHDPYFVQKINVSRDLIGRSRSDVFKQICQGRRILHIGCADWPITDARSSLHVQLDAVCAHLDGFDVHPEAFELLRPHVRGNLFSNWDDITADYDVILIPEVMEHVPNVQDFLQRIDHIRSGSVILTVPDAFQCMRRHFDYSPETETFFEVVHPDHNCWYTPYTLASTLQKYTPWHIEGMWFFNNISLLTVASRTPPKTP